MGGHAGVLTHDPYFEANFKKATEFCSDTNPIFHPKSPAGQILEKCGRNINSKAYIEFNDPHDLAGGFGRSTAEFITAKYALDLKKNQHNSIDFFHTWNEYRNIFKEHQNIPSGYDLLAQCQNTLFENLSLYEQYRTKKYPMSGQLSVISTEENEVKILKSDKLFSGLNILVFKTKKKIKTHEHLEGLKKEKFEHLKASSLIVTNAYDTKNQQTFLNALQAFDLQLLKLNLKCVATLKVIDRIQKIKGVSYARGCGALGADVLAVFYHGTGFKELVKNVQKIEDLIFIANVNGID